MIAEAKGRLRGRQPKLVVSISVPVPGRRGHARAVCVTHLRDPSA